MRRISSFLGLAALSALVVTTGFSASIGLNFQGRDSAGAAGIPPIAPNETAGVVPQANWNNWDNFANGNNGTIGTALDNSGNLTAVTIIFNGNDSWNSDGPTGTPDERLMAGIIKRQGLNTASTFIFTNLSSGPYDVYVYTSMNGDNVLIDTTIGSTTYYTFEDHQFAGTFIQATNTVPAGPRDVGNYVKFSGVTPTANAIRLTTTWRGGGDGIGIAGLQIVGSFAANSSPIQITQQPASRRLLTNTTATLTVVTDVAATNYQWFKNDVLIPGANSSSYTLPPVTAADNGAKFYVRVANNVNSVQSTNAFITIGQSVQLQAAKEELWFGADRTTVESGAQDSVTPDILLARPIFEAVEEQGSDFGQRVSGLFRPDVSGNYVFFINSDDDSDLFMSTDANPAGKVMIAQETGWSGSRNWTGSEGGSSLTQKRSDRFSPDGGVTFPATNGFALVGGTSYYLEAVHHEGGGGDNVGVTFKKVGEPDPVPGTQSRINSFLLAPYAFGLNGATITLTQPPLNTIGIQNQTATFSVTATAGYIGDTSTASPGLAFQWQSAAPGSSTFTNISGANGSSFTTPALAPSDNGRQFRVAMMAGDASLTTQTATLTISPDTTGPRPVDVISVSADGRTIVLSFNEALNKASAETVANYSFSPGGITPTNASLDSAGTTVTLKTGTALTPNVTDILTITGVRDSAGNAVPANTTISFTYSPVTYSANILFDGPVAYYRFEDATGSPIAVNSGSTGGNGAYYTGDETVPNGGGNPSSAKGDPGPRPPAFAGFDVNNLAATLTGSSVDGGADDWIDAKNQFLQNRAAFSLEYWVKPQRTNTDGTTWGNRIGIVGQNDAIEYGFIDPGTIQIWTPNGGALNTAYNYLDNEWHHVATIASGTSIKTYYDGVLQGTVNTSTIDYGGSSFNVHIGGGGVFDATGNYFRGQIDEVAIFDKAIPAARILAHFTAGKDGGVITTSGTVTPPQVVLSATHSGSNIIISWAPTGGTLESTPALNGASTVWTSAGSSNPATIPISSGNRFFRVRNP